MAAILIAEDDPAVREFVSRALTAHGFSVTAVDDGEQALDAACQGRYDLLITDVIMPGMDGLTLAVEVNRRCPDMRVLVMTGFAAEEQRARVEDDYVKGVISKPFTLQQICSAAKTALAA